MKQLSVFLEKKSGNLYKVTSLLANAGLSLKAVSLNEGSDFGILRIITDDIVKAAETLENEGFPIRVVDVLVVEIDDEIGAFNRVVEILTKNSVDIEYCYTLNSQNKGAFVFKVNNIIRAREAFKENSVVFK